MKLGMVFEGGASRTIFSCGVADAFLEENIMPDYFIGVSAGIAFGLSYLSKQHGRNLELARKYMSDGNYQGYPVVITTESTVYHVRINAVSAQDPDNTQLAQYLEYQKQNVKHLADYSCTSTSALLTIKMPAVNGNKVPDMINSVVDPLIQYLHGGNYQPCCESCGNTQEYLSNYEVNGSYHYLCTCLLYTSPSPRDRG